MVRRELERKSKDELITIILDQEESFWNWMAIAQDIARTKGIVDKKYERLMIVVTIYTMILIAIIVVFVKNLV
ncbi:MAG: hypothetical protein J6T44_05945 [Prevotella sp.]|nr:hypothetical protein [Prevotella sp.]